VDSVPIASENVSCIGYRLAKPQPPQTFPVSHLDSLLRLTKENYTVRQPEFMTELVVLTPITSPGLKSVLCGPFPANGRQAKAASDGPLDRQRRWNVVPGRLWVSSRDRMRREATQAVVDEVNRRAESTIALLVIIAGVSGGSACDECYEPAGALYAAENPKRCPEERGIASL
jgi:hypothetical protein